MIYETSIPNRARTDFLYVRHRGDIDRPVLRDTFLGDANHLDGIADQIHGRVCIDAGANIGTVTVKLLDLGARFILAIEPEPANLALLRENVAAHPRGEKQVRVLEGAVGNPSRTGMVETVGTGGSAWTVPASGEGVRVFSFAEIVSAAISLGDVDAEENVAHCKVDVEGGEYDWFDTAREQDLARVDRFSLEFHGTDTHSEHLGPEDGRYGRLMTKLALTHSVQAFGSAAAGGMAFAHSYLL